MRRVDRRRWRITRPPAGDRLIILFRLPLLLLLGVTIYGVIGYRVIEGWSLLDALYLTVITLATVGFREVQPLDAKDQAFTISLILALSVALGSVTELVVSGQPARVLRMRRMDARIERLDRHPVICAYGRVGRAVAEELTCQDLPLWSSSPGRPCSLPSRSTPSPTLPPTPPPRRSWVAPASSGPPLVCAVDPDAVNVYITLTAAPSTRSW